MTDVPVVYFIAQNMMLLQDLFYHIIDKYVFK